MISCDETHALKMALVHIARGYVGLRETGHNQGELIEKFQKAVDGRASGEPWCMAAVQYWVKSAQELVESIAMQTLTVQPKLFSTEHCMTAWEKTPRAQRKQAPEVGDIIIWQRWELDRPTQQGHVGLVSRVLSDNTVKCIEGNTVDHSDIKREGDGVYEITRIYPLRSGILRYCGTLSVW